MNFLGKQVGCNHSKRTEQRSQKYTNLSDVNGKIDQVQEIVNDDASDHQTGIDCSANNTTQWIPTS